MKQPCGWIGLISALVGVIGLGSLAAFYRQLRDSWQTYLDKTRLSQGLSADIYSPEIIENALRYYIEPNCQSIDPAGGDEPRGIIGAKQPLLSMMDEALVSPTQYRYIIILADSGMGKTTFMINYYARNIRRRRRQFEIALLPLGIPDVDERIQAITNQKNTVLFLDAYDEDTRAIKNHGERLATIIQLTREFKKVVITCRTQFFPSDEEIPLETGIIKVGVPRAAGESAVHRFHKLYLSPFSDEQVKQYIRKRYTIWQGKKRRQAWELVQKIRNLCVRPMLLGHVNELIQHDIQVSTMYDLYHAMVQAWLVREEGVFPEIKKEPLLKFSERIALDIYRNRTERRAERLTKEEVVALAQQWEIPLDEWQLTGRSLLNRDAKGNYKFAHRSIMEFLLVKKLIEGDPNYRFNKLTDQMTAFLVDKIDEIKPEREYRKTPDKSLPVEQVKSMLKRHDFYDRDYHPRGQGITHRYLPLEKDGESLVIDLTTGLMWQQSGLEKNVVYKDAIQYIEHLKRDNFAGYDDWRLPTLEEAMSLMEPTEKNANLYIDPVFDKSQSWIWTADQTSAVAAWVAGFYGGGCYGFRLDFPNSCVRAVR